MEIIKNNMCDADDAARLLLEKRIVSDYLEHNKREYSSNSVIVFDSVMSKINRSRRLGSLKRLVAVAAIFIFAFMGYATISAFNNPFSFFASLGDEVIYVSNAHTNHLILADGTNVWLNADSKLRYFTDNDSDIREVFLDGEAYFEVARDESKEFVIRTQMSSVKVLGTKFNVKSYPEMNRIVTSVLSGKVVFSSHNASLILTANKVGSFNKKNNLMESSVEDTSISNYWVRGEILFNATTLEEIGKILERRFNVKISVSKTLESKRITASFKDENIEDIIKLLAMTNEFNYKRNNNNIYEVY